MKLSTKTGKMFGPNVKLMALPLIAIIVMSVLLVIVAKEGYSRIRGKMSDLEVSKKSEEAMQNRLDNLKQVQSNLLKNSDATVVALPDKNPSTWVVSQIKSNSERLLASVDNIQIDTRKDIKDINGMKLRSTIKADDYTKLIELAQQLTNIAPVTTIDTLDVAPDDASRGNYKMDMELGIYWSDLPTELPNLNSPLKEFDFQETELLNRISQLQEPVFVDLEPNNPQAPENPFLQE